jgi:hypothetical protein
LINEEVSRKTLSLTVQGVKEIAQDVKKFLDVLIKKLDNGKISLEQHLKDNSSEIKLKDMVKKGQLEELSVKDGELKELKKELNKHGVKFSVMKDKETGNYTVFFQAKDLAVMEKAFRNTLSTVEKKEKQKESIKKTIDKFRDMAKDTISKDKVRNKQKEQSL